MNLACLLRQLAVCVILIAFCACAHSESWFGVDAGVSSNNHNANDEPARMHQGPAAMNNAKLNQGGVNIGVRSNRFLGVMRVYTDIFARVAQGKITTDAVGEWTGSIKQFMFGADYGLYFTDFFYAFVNPFPYLCCYLYTAGSKIRPNPGRTTDKGRTWDTGFTYGLGAEFKFAKFMSVGLEYRQFLSFQNGIGIDSSGFEYKNNFYGAMLKIWY